MVGTTHKPGGEGLIAFTARAAAALALVGIGLVFLMVFAYALPVFMQKGTDAVFSWVWNPYQGQFGILPMLVGSLLLAFSTMLVAWPLALALCCRLLCAPRGPVASLTGACIRFMTAVPTVVYGFLAVFLLTPLVRQGLGGSGLCWLSAMVMLVFLVLPTMVLILESGLAQRLDPLWPKGAAVGFSRLDLLWYFVFPGSGKLFVSAAILGFGRAVGDTLLPLMLAGNAPQVPESLADSLRALTAHMALVTANEVGGSAYNSLFVAGALLLGINTVISLVLRRIAAGSRDV
ncbi:ABC transporter permease subunit [Desulfovibrio sp. OttesenSCG-928-G15]|nr:ABC transporter permease subunit [Desulfovibrio sp. OttesenSCG-928-G15]